ncbi:MAG: MFS transporter [Xanthomonadaceae bacterium]|nr:MFS transporter [Xanthomonadaceae bacterium]MDE2280210.1 MFS transporter [Xanthomonadaceae bacterium]MDE2316264.1 MFS transporter [Xanthomonadaceae bacterium]
MVIGRICQSFDLFVFGLGCVLAFPEVFFPFASHMDGVFYSFVLFALAFVARPLGSMFFVVLQRQIGAAAKLTIALFLLGMATAGTAFLPGYATLGWSAIGALAVLRFVQGFALGGSWNGLASLAALKAPRDKRGWYAMLPQLADPLGFVLAAALFAYIWAALTPQEFIEWGWRYPFFAAFAINVVSLFASLRMVVAPRYAEQLKERDLEPTSMRSLMRAQGRNVALGTFAPLASYALFHLVTIFALSWALLYTQQSVTSFLLVQVVGALVAMPCMIISGKVANRFGRRTTLAVGSLLIAVYSGWTALLLSGGVVNSYLFVIVGYALLGFAHAQAAGAVSANFPPEFRYSGAMITSDLGWLIGAGFAPLVALSLAIYAGVPYVGLYLLTGAIGTLAALWFSRQGGLPND